MKKEATNTFKKGLAMDFNPMVTPSDVITNNLNGTFVTYNGNELILQNDMGNGRINRVRLDEGYVPTGIAERGGIIYVTSYNPSTGYGQIGSFPYPKVNYYPDNFDNQDDSKNWALEAYVNSNYIITTYKIINNKHDKFYLPMFVNNYIYIPLLYKDGELMTIRCNDSFSNELPLKFLDFIDCEGIKANYVVISGGSKTYIDAELDEEIRELKIKNGNIIYYSGKQSGKLYLELYLKPIDEFVVSQDIVKKSHNSIEITFISETPMYIRKFASDEVNSNSKETKNGENYEISLLNDNSFSKIYNDNLTNIDLTAYPITKDYGIDGTNPRSISFNPLYLIALEEILSKYRYKWEDGKLTLNWSYLSILQEDLSSSQSKYTFNHYFYDINIVNKALQENAIHTSDFSDLIINSNYNPSVKIIGEKIYNSVSNSFQETFDLPKGVFLHIITTKKVGGNEKIRVLRFVYGTTYLNLYFDNEDIKDFINLKYYLHPTEEWVEILNFDIDDQIFNMHVEVEKSKYKERNKSDWSLNLVIDPVLTWEYDAQGTEEEIFPEEFYNKINITFSPNIDENDKVNINLNSSTYEEHILDSSVLRMNADDIHIGNVYDYPEYSDSNYSMLASLAEISDSGQKHANKVTIHRGIYSNSTGGKLLLEKKITGLYPLYLPNYDNNDLLGFEDYGDSIVGVAGKTKVIWLDVVLPILYEETDDPELELDNGNAVEEGATVRQKILEATINTSERERRNGNNSCFNIISGVYEDDDASFGNKHDNPVDERYSTFMRPDSHKDQLDARGMWHLITIRDSKNHVRVLPFGGRPIFPYSDYSLIENYGLTTVETSQWVYTEDGTAIQTDDNGNPLTETVYALAPDNEYSGIRKVYARKNKSTKQELKQSTENPIYIDDQVSMFWIPAHLKLYNFLSLIFTLSSKIGNYYIIGADGISTVYSIPDSSYFEYNFLDTYLNSNVKSILTHISEVTLSNRDRVKLDSSCIPNIKINGNKKNLFYYGNNINLNSYEFKNILNRYNSVYETTQDVFEADNDISYDDIYFFDWRKLKDPDLIGTIYSNGKYAVLLPKLVVGLNPKYSAYVYNIHNTRPFLTNTKKSNVLANGNIVTSLKDWNGYNFFISNMNDNFITVHNATNLYPGLIDVEGNGILLRSDVANVYEFMWEKNKAEHAFDWASINFYNHDMLNTPYYNGYWHVDDKLKGLIVTDNSLDYIKNLIINSNVLKKLYKSIQESMLNYAKINVK